MKRRIREIRIDMEQITNRRDRLRANLNGVNRRLEQLKAERAEIRDSMAKLGITE